MPPLTLEQVLARSMRLPRQRTQQQVSRLLNGPAAAGAVPSLDEAGATRTWSSASGGNTGRSSASGGRSSAAAAGYGKFNFFEMMERDEAKRRAGRLSIHPSGHLVRNSADLTTYLQAARRTGDWEGGLRAFVDATATPALAAAATTDDAGAASPAAASAPPSASPALPAATDGISPNTSQIISLLDMCAGADQWALVERIGTYFAPTHPDAFTHVVELLAQRTPPPPSSSSQSESPSAVAPSWRVAFAFVTSRCPLPAAEVPVAAFNVCLRGCESALDWRGALEVVRAMGPNPLQGWKSAEEGGDGAEVCVGAAAATDEGGAAAAEAALRSLPPPPDVVSYATLIATLEQSGKEGLASEVLNRLPPVEKEEITASYAALIAVWSTQILRRQRRRF